MLLADTEEKVAQLVKDGKAGLQEIDGTTYLVGSPYYASPISLKATRLAPCGSLEATQIFFSNDYPQAGETVEVSAAIENTGLTTAHGCPPSFGQDRKRQCYRYGIQ